MKLEAQITLESRSTISSIHPASYDPYNYPPIYQFLNVQHQHRPTFYTVKFLNHGGAI